MSERVLRRPTVADVSEIVELIKQGVERGANLPRSRHYVCENIRDFVVISEGERLVACASLHVLWRDFAEVRSVSCLPGPDCDALYAWMIDSLIEDARRLGVERVLAFAFDPAPFLPLNFQVVERESLPQIAWRECMDCVHFPRCRETALIRELHPERTSPPVVGSGILHSNERTLPS